MKNRKVWALVKPDGELYLALYSTKEKAEKARLNAYPNPVLWDIICLQEIEE